MSALSKRCLREKRHLRRVLESAAQAEIDEYLANRGLLDDEYERWVAMREDDPRDDEPDDDWDDYVDDPSYYVFDDYRDDYYDYERYVDDDWDSDFTYNPYYDINCVGLYYKDEKANRTYLCVQVGGVVTLVDIHTGKENGLVTVRHLKKIG